MRRIKRSMLLLIVLMAFLSLTACSGISQDKENDSNSLSGFGEDTVTSSEMNEWLDALEEWENSSISGGASDSNDSLENNNGTSDSNSNHTSDNKDSYENGGNWTQGWY